MNVPEQYRAAEKELMEELSALTCKNSFDSAQEDCPSSDELSLFVRSKVSEQRREQLVTHLSICDRCVGFLRKERQGRPSVKEAGLVFAAAAALVLAVIWGLRTPISTSTKVATVDLRPLSSTRGGESGAAAGETPAINGRASRVRIILPAGSEGKYECEILTSRENLVLTHVSGETSLLNHQVVLEISLRRSSVEAGKYLLGLRKQGDQWTYYPLIFK